MKLRDIFKKQRDTGYREGPYSTFTHQGETYLVDDLLQMCIGLPIITFPLTPLAWLYDSKADPRRLSNADPRIPIIILEYEKNRWVTIDGFHRVNQALRNNERTIKAKVVDMALLSSLKPR